MTLRSQLNLDSNDEIHLFLKSTKNKTAQMKYDQFVKKALDQLRPIMVDYLDNKVKPQFVDCKTIQSIEALKIPALPDHIREWIIDFIDGHKTLDIVERVYLSLDLIRAVSNNLGTTVGHMALHYANAIRAAPTIVQSNGKSF